MEEMQRVRFVGRGARLPCSGRQHSGSMPTRLPKETLPGGGGRFKRGGTYKYLQLILVDGWQKPT